MMPALVGFVFTFLISKSAFSQINPATIKYAADDISPGTSIFWPISFGLPTIEAVRPSAWAYLSYFGAFINLTTNHLQYAEKL